MPTIPPTLPIQLIPESITSLEEFKNVSGSWLYETNSAVIAIALFAFLVLANDLSFRLGKRSRTTIETYYDGNFRVLKSSLLGLMALLLAFTFNAANIRHETNQTLVMQESNLLYSIMLESRGLPRPEREAFLQDLARYSQVRLDFFFAGRDLDKVDAAIVNTKVIHAQMWDRIQHRQRRRFSVFYPARYPSNPAAGRDALVFRENSCLFSWLYIRSNA